MMPTSYHFIPANKPKLFERLPQIGADCYVFDLEDAVPAQDKEAALQSLSGWLSDQPSNDSWYVRLNGHESEWSAKEREFLAAFPWLSVVLPKLSTSNGLEQAVKYYGLAGRKVVGLIEDATALRQLDAILQTKRLSAIGLGLEDFLSDSIYTPDQVADLVQQVRTQLALAAMAHGIEAIDTLSLDFSEKGASLMQEAIQARSAGMTAKFSIHPNQVGIIHQCFSADAGLVDQAKRHQAWLESAPVDASGYFKKDGVVFSPPKIKKLRRVVEWLSR